MPGVAIYMYGLLTSTPSLPSFLEIKGQKQRMILINRCFRVVGYLCAIFE
jgi:hypothetical protein